MTAAVCLFVGGLSGVVYFTRGRETVVAPVGRGPGGPAVVPGGGQAPALVRRKEGGSDPADARARAAERLAPRLESETRPPAKSVAKEPSGEKTTGLALTIRVVDEDDMPLRSGTATLFGPGALSPPGAESKLVLAGDAAPAWFVFRLSETNPARFGFTDTGYLPYLGATLKLRVEANGYPVTQKGFPLELGATSVTVVVPSSRRATLTLRDAATEAPVAEAQVVARESGKLRGEWRLIEAVSDPEGTCLLRGLTEGPFDLEVTAWGYARVAITDTVLDGEKILWLHELGSRPAGRVEVAVYRPDGSPWPRTKVLGRIAGRTVEEETDDKGICRFERLPAGKHEFMLALSEMKKTQEDRLFHRRQAVSLESGGFMKVALGSAPGSARLLLKVVSADGRPMPGCVVMATGPTPFIFQGKTNAEVELNFRRLAAGFYPLAFTKPTRWDLLRPIEISEGVEREATITAGNRMFVVKVRGTGAEGLAAAKLKGDDRLGTARTEGDGRFAFDGALAGSYELRFEGRAGIDVPLKLEVIVAESGAAEELEVDLDRLGTLEVEVSDGAGKPVSGVGVTCSGADGKSVVLDPRFQGGRAQRFAALLSAGEYLVLVQAPGRGARSEVIEIDSKRTKTVTVTLGGD